MSQQCEFKPDEVRRSDHGAALHVHMDWVTVRADMVRRTGLSRQETRLVAKNHSFLFNMQGEARLGEDYLDGRRVTFKPRRVGSIVFLPAGSEWTGWDEGDSNASYMFLSVATEFVRQTLGDQHIAELRPVIGLDDLTIETALRRIAEELKSPDPTSAMMVESQAIQILVHMVRLLGLKLKPAKGGFSSFDLKRLVTFMNMRLSDPPTSQELAQEVGVSQRHFFRAFKESTGKSPFAFMGELRMMRAKDLLRTTDRTATEIALECGFASPSHFTYAFRKVHGISPSEFRRRWRIVSHGVV